MLEGLKRWFERGVEVARRESDTLPAMPRPADGAPIVIDVRTEREYAGSALEGAINIPLARLQSGIRRVVGDLETPLVLYCASGARSGLACTLLVRMGYVNVSNAGSLFTAAARLRTTLR